MPVYRAHSPLITPSTVSFGGLFGSELSMTDSFLAVGAPGTTVNDNVFQGSVFLYKLDNHTK
jgi:hypothetical protein